MSGMNAATGRAIQGTGHLRQSIQTILSTGIGERALRRTFGSRLADLIDQPATPALELEIYAATTDALARWEPRLSIEQVLLAADEPGSRWTLTLAGTDLSTGEPVTLTDLLLTGALA